MSMIKAEIPPFIVALQKELAHHQDILEAVRNEPGGIEQALGMIAARLNIVLDGYYDAQPLCEMLTKQLYQKRTVVIQKLGDTRQIVVPNMTVLAASAPVPQQLLGAPITSIDFNKKKTAEVLDVEDATIVEHPANQSNQILN